MRIKRLLFFIPLKYMDRMPPTQIFLHSLSYREASKPKDTSISMLEAKVAKPAFLGQTA